jgi:hypothetical protein
MWHRSTGFLVFDVSTQLCSKKVKLSRYRPGQALGVPGSWGSRIFKQSAHGGKVVSPTHRPSLPQEGFLVLVSVRNWVDPRATMRPEGLSYWKIPVTPSGIEPATFRFVAQCLNQLRHRVPRSFVVSYLRVIISLDVSTFEDETSTLFRFVGHQWPSNLAPHLRRTEVSVSEVSSIR